MPESRPAAPNPLSAAAEQRLRRAFALLIVAGGLGIAAASRLPGGVNLPFLPLRLQASDLLLAGLLTALLGLAALRMRPQLGLLMASLLAATLGLFALGYHELRRGDVDGLAGDRRIWQSPTEWTEQHIYEHPLFGWRGEPGAVARQHHRDFQVTYRLDEEGWRRLPRPGATGAREVWFLGCSFTFGIGVEDEQVYVHQLAARAWPGVPVRNFSASGWGTSNVWQALQQQLAERPAPAAVVYGWIGHHRQRNYLRQSWFARSNPSLIPWFELENGALQWKGMASQAVARIPDSAELDARERALTVALMRAMLEATRARGVPLVLLVLDNAGEPVLDELRALPGLHVLDVGGESTDFHPYDGHPAAVWHQTVAHVIARDPLLARVSGIAALHAPGRIPEPPMRRWQLSQDAATLDRGRARIRYPAQDGGVLRATPGATVFDNAWQLVLKGPHFALRQGGIYAVEARLRADGPRRLPWLVSRSAPPWGPLGLQDELSLGPDWRTVRRIFVASADDTQAQLMFLLGGGGDAVELQGEPVLRELTGTEADAARALLTQPAWQLSLAGVQGAEAVADGPVLAPPLRLALGVQAGADPWAVQLRRGGLALRAGRRYELEITWRADAPRQVVVAVSQDHAPWQNRGLYLAAPVSTELQTLRQAFVADADEAGAQISLAAGGGTPGLEIVSVRLRESEGPGGDGAVRDLLQPRP